jgi:hypothetical protein
MTGSEKPSVPQQAAEERAEDCVAHDLLRKDSSVGQQREIAICSPLGMNSVHDREGRPGHEVLRLGRDDSPARPGQAQPGKQPTEHSSVGEMHGEAGKGPPPAPGDDSAEQTGIGVGRLKQPLQ